jgi:hypothetical protein
MPLGLFGTIWDSQDDAVRAAARYVDSLIVAHQILKNYEVGGFVYYSGKGFSYNITTSFRSGSIRPSDIDSIRVSDAAALWHTHNFLVDTGSGELFSGYETGDKGLSRSYSLPIYLYSPQHRIYSFEDQGNKIQNVIINGRQKAVSLPYGIKTEVSNVEPKAL